jgi:uncharacterized protein YukE
MNRWQNYRQQREVLQQIKALYAELRDVYHIIRGLYRELRELYLEQTQRILQQGEIDRQTKEGFQEQRQRLLSEISELSLRVDTIQAQIAHIQRFRPTWIDRM